MLKNKIFGIFESNLEFCLVMSAAAPLYSETFDPNAALQKALQTNYVAESHSKRSKLIQASFPNSDKMRKRRFICRAGEVFRLPRKPAQGNGEDVGDSRGRGLDLSSSAIEAYCSENPQCAFGDCTGCKPCGPPREKFAGIEFDS